MAHADRVRRLEELQGSHPAERALLDGQVLAYEPHDTDASGVNSTFYVELSTDVVAFHKPHDGIVARIAPDYGHASTPRRCVSVRRGSWRGCSATRMTDSSR